jgi:hypothetical protein
MIICVVHFLHYTPGFRSSEQNLLNTWNVGWQTSNYVIHCHVCKMQLIEAWLLPKGMNISTSLLPMQRKIIRKGEHAFLIQKQASSTWENASNTIVLWTLFWFQLRSTALKSWPSRSTNKHDEKDLLPDSFL